ncbi:MAG: hypothetical protein RL136_689 [Planctomycetota bacterium]|jgi:hypothetical protein
MSSPPSNGLMQFREADRKPIFDPDSLHFDTQSMNFAELAVWGGQFMSIHTRVISRLIPARLSHDFKLRAAGTDAATENPGDHPSISPSGTCTDQPLRGWTTTRHLEWRSSPTAIKVLTAVYGVPIERRPPERSSGTATGSFEESSLPIQPTTAQFVAVLDARPYGFAMSANAGMSPRVVGKLEWRCLPPGSRTPDAAI